MTKLKVRLTKEQAERYQAVQCFWGKLRDVE